LTGVGGSRYPSFDDTWWYASGSPLPITQGEAAEMAAELSLIEKCAVDTLRGALARFSDQSPFGPEGLAAFARALQSMSWKVVGDIHEIANAPPSSVKAEERIRRTFVTVEDSLLARPALDAGAFRAYVAISEAGEEDGVSQ
jgi:hypothetical protein